MKNFILSLFALTVVGALFAQNINSLRKLQIAQMAISGLYVDSVDEEKLAEDGIRGMLEQLDPHSSYTTAKETKAMNEPLQGSFDGIGVQFNMMNDTLLVIQTVTKGPSEKVGICAGDRIITVNDTTIAGVKMSRTDIMRRLRGPRGTKVKIGICRRGVPEPMQFTVTRNRIPVKTLDAAYIIRPKVGYIRIGSFGVTTYKEFMTAVDSLEQKGMHDLILDLQDNGGGYLQAAVEIANEFLQKNDLIVYTQGRRSGRHEYRAQGNGRLLKGKVIVLVNEYTASAAEIVTGAIQDQDRGTVVGRRSFGKGLVQRPVEFDDGSMIRLTIAHYYTPAGRCIQKPYQKGDRDEYAQDIEKRYKHGELYSADSIHFADSLKCQTLRRHRTVYGGGGIMPDHFVPLDTTQFTKLYRQIIMRSIMVTATLKYVDDHRAELHASYPVFSDFLRDYQAPEAQIDSILAEAARQKVHTDDEAELSATRKQLAVQFKALVARDIWDMDEYFAIVNEQSHVVRKAVQLLTGK